MKLGRRVLLVLFALPVFRAQTPSDAHEWVVGSWESCSATCGGGMQSRELFCAEKTNSLQGAAENRHVDDSYCFQQKKPDVERACATHECPVWEIGEWSQCSVTCGKGVKVRKIACQQERYREMARHACNPKDTPESKQVCYTGITCQEAEETKMADYERYRYVAAAPFTQWDDGGGRGGASGAGASPSWLPGQWSECSRSCGAGVRTRGVECGAFQPITRGLLRLPDFECRGGAKPPEFQPCELRQCSEAAPPVAPAPLLGGPGGKAAHSWEYGDWEPCSASCLGGKQKSRLRCVELAGNRSVAWSYCDPRQRPVDMSRACNRQACPPAWEIGGWSVCSHSCGGGLRTRRVRCSRDMGPGRGRLIMPDVQCSGARASDREPCALVACPAEWVKGGWTECSRTCGQGEQRRSLSCQKRGADGQLRTLNPPSLCEQPMPPSIQLCTLGSCERPETNPRVAAKTTTVRPDLQSTLKNFEQGQNHRRLTLRVGGRATLYEGTSVKLKCPVKNFDRSKIEWTKNGQPISATNRMKVSRFGALRLFRAKAKDAGLYSCKAGGLEGNITLIFKPHFPFGEPEKSNKTPFWAKTKAGKEKSLDDAEAKVDVAAELSRLPQAQGDAVSGKNPSRGLIQELKDYLLRNQKLDVYQALRNVESAGAVGTEWVTGEWSPCSQSCGTTGGMAFRSVQCKVNVSGFTSYVDDSICSDFGLSKPHEMRLCALSACPSWVSGEWSECENSRCLRFSTALQRRSVSCVFPNGTKVEAKFCASKTRPRRKKECFSDACQAKWRAGNWQPCSRSCGEDGVQMRVVRCVWGETRKAAGNNCQGSERPKLLRPCADRPPCPNAPPEQPGPFKAGCWDESRHCGVARSLNLCRDYRDRCCLSCSLPKPTLKTR